MACSEIAANGKVHPKKFFSVMIAQADYNKEYYIFSTSQYHAIKSSAYHHQEQWNCIITAMVSYRYNVATLTTCIYISPT